MTSLLASWKGGERGELKSNSSVVITIERKEHMPDPFSQDIS